MLTCWRRGILVACSAALLMTASVLAENKPKKNRHPEKRALEERLLELEDLVSQQAEQLRRLQEQLAALNSDSRTSLKTGLLSTAPGRGGVRVQPGSGLSDSSIPASHGKWNGQPKSVSPLVAGWTGSHPFIASADGNFRMQLGGRAQLDWRSYTGTVTPPSSFFVRRARLEAEGELYHHFEYKVQADFADTGSRLLRDGYLNINASEALQFKFGQFKAPFSQEELQSSKYIDFVERSSVNNLVPGRSPGVMLHGALSSGVFQYYIGAFNGLGALKSNTSSTPEGFVRLRFTPFKNGGSHLFQHFSFGGAFGNGRHKGGSSLRGRTASRSIQFFKGVPVNGEITRANAEFWWRYKAFSLRGEFDQTHQHRDNLGSGGTNLPGVIGKGYVIQATYLLTGEDKTEKGISPASAFLGTDGNGSGAWELAFRYENLKMDDSQNGNRSEAFTFGVNWWLTKFVRYQSNLVLERFSDRFRAPTPGDRDSFSYLSRIQVIF